MMGAQPAFFEALCEPAAGSVALPLQVFLHQGGVHCAGLPTVISTVLGSCVSVCLWDRTLSVGGMNHFVLPGDADASERYSDSAIDSLVEAMVALGSHSRQIEAKVFGGGAVLPTTGPSDAIGVRNAAAALIRLDDWRIPVVASDVGGGHGRFLRFDTATGVVMMRRLRKTPLV
jgi:chemotaxis protein CheD